VGNAIAGLPIEKAVFDGEVVVEDRQGIADFAALQDALKVETRQSPSMYSIFFTSTAMM
jgi:ATP-dependent DNA ligase